MKALYTEFKKRQFSISLIVSNDIYLTKNRHIIWNFKTSILKYKILYSKMIIYDLQSFNSTYLWWWRPERRERHRAVTLCEATTHQACVPEYVTDVSVAVRVGCVHAAGN